MIGQPEVAGRYETRSTRRARRSGNDVDLSLPMARL